MEYYKISKGNWSVIDRFNNIDEANARAEGFGTGYAVEYVAPYVAPSPEARLSLDMKFCNELINIFLQDNRIAGVTAEQGEALMSKFSTVLSFAQGGAIKSVDYHIKNMTVDDVFTQPRKDKYMSLIRDYLSQF